MAPSKELDTVLEMIRVRSAEVRKTTDDDRLSYERIMSVLPMADAFETGLLYTSAAAAEEERDKHCRQATLQEKTMVSVYT